MGRPVAPRCEVEDFQSSFGLWPFKRTLNISSGGFEWCGEVVPLKEITRLRWGVEQVRGGIFSKRVCYAVFGTDKREYEIKTKQVDFYDHLRRRYWKAIGVRLLNEMLEGLARGESRTFDSLAVSDSGICVRGKKLFGAPKPLFYEWGSLSWEVVNGALCFAEGKSAERLLASLSFLWVDNVHVLYAALKLLELAPRGGRLSEVLGPGTC